MYNMKGIEMENINNIPIGCKKCMQCKKKQVHITFLCNKHCSYCPIPDEKFGLDFIEVTGNKYNANEIDKVIENICQDTEIEGISISGGEPFLVFDKAVYLIEKIKKIKGNEFHIHLYTNGMLLSQEKLDLLEKSGLDELRIDSLEPEIFGKLKNTKINVVCEIPCIPDKVHLDKLKRLLFFLDKYNIKYLNLNEFEVTKENYDMISKLNLTIKDNRVVESKKGADEIKEFIIENNLDVNVFFCTFEIADKIRISRNRINN